MTESTTTDATTRGRRDRHRGSISTFFAILMIMLISMSSLVYEGGRRLANISRAEDIAGEAARAAAATVDPYSIAIGDPAIDTSSAEGARYQAEALVDAAGGGARLVAFETSPTGRAVTVTVRIDATSWIPGLDLSADARHTAQIIDPNEDQ